MSERLVDVFFYGLFMDQNRLRTLGIAALDPRPASVEGFGLRVGKRATLVPASDERSYGMVMKLTPHDLNELYSAEGLDQYHPQAVTCTTFAGEAVPALCYNLRNAPAPDAMNEEYAAQLRDVLTNLGFPAEYVERVR